jgi:hypothetical protein
VGRPMSPSGALARRSSGRMGAGGRTDWGVGVGSPEDIGTGCPGDPQDCLRTGPDCKGPPVGIDQVIPEGSGPGVGKEGGREAPAGASGL